MNDHKYIGGVWIPQSDTDVKSILTKRVFSDGESPDPNKTFAVSRILTAYAIK